MMNPLNLVSYPHKSLKTPAIPFDFENPPIDPLELEAEMITVMLGHNGIGLASNQVDVPYSVFIIGTEQSAMAIFNPTIISKSFETISDFEGCLSFPGIKLLIKRPVSIEVEYYNSNGEKFEQELFDMDCRIFCHEMDHLLGVTFKDLVSDFKWNLAKKRKI